MNTDFDFSDSLSPEQLSFISIKKAEVILKFEFRQ